MNIIIILIAISLSIAILFLSIYFWNIRSEQYDDTITPAMRILLEDNAGRKKTDASTTSGSRNCERLELGEKKFRSFKAIQQIRGRGCLTLWGVVIDASLIDN